MLRVGAERGGVGLFAGCVLLGAPSAAVLWDPCLSIHRSTVYGLLSARGLIWAQGGSTEHKQLAPPPHPKGQWEFGELKADQCAAPLMPEQESNFDSASYWSCELRLVAWPL